MPFRRPSGNACRRSGPRGSAGGAWGRPHLDQVRHDLGRHCLHRRDRSTALHVAVRGKRGLVDADRTGLRLAYDAAEERQRAGGGALGCPQLERRQAEGTDHPPVGHGGDDVAPVAVERDGFGPRRRDFPCQGRRISDMENSPFRSSTGGAFCMGTRSRITSAIAACERAHHANMPSNERRKSKTASFDPPGCKVS